LDYQKIGMPKKINLLVLAFSILSTAIYSQSISGKLLDEADEAIQFANVVLYYAQDSSICKIEVSDENGAFSFSGVSSESYFVKTSFVGYEDIETQPFDFQEGSNKELGTLTFEISATELEVATVTARRAMVEVKPDRTVFNIEGTINASGSDGISLLRKAPGVVVDNNNNINVLGRSGVLVYIDGKRLPISGDDLTNYLQSLSSDQIDKIDIITNPGAKYEAEGNAGIIDIKLKKDKSIGTNGSISSSFSMGQKPQFNTSLNANTRTKKFNVYGSLGGNLNERFNDIEFTSVQNNIYLDEIANFVNSQQGLNLRLGVDYFLSSAHTFGVLINSNNSTGDSNDTDRIEISSDPMRINIDSTLLATTDAERDFSQNSINLNYRYAPKSDFSINADVDYGLFDINQYRLQPNQFFQSNGQSDLLSEVIVEFDTPRKIEIITSKIDIEQKVNQVTLGYGAKLSIINSENSFEVFDVINSNSIRDDRRSNLFDYDEHVYAGYINLSSKLNDFWSFSSGIRAEQTNTTGDLTAYLPEFEEDPIDQSYLKFFPNIGFTYSKNPMHLFGINYGRRINRPDYQVLNPFNNQLSEISFEKGNPNLQPEIVNNLELSYTWQYRYNFKLSYSRTTDQITRLIGPDDTDPRASFINWDNLAEQTIYNANMSLPIDITPKWSSYINAGIAYIDNQADYGDGAVVDIQTMSYNLYQQQTIKLPKDYVFEISGYYAGPGVWGGVFLYDSSYSLNFGIQKKFFNKKLNVKLTANDVTYQSFWSGSSEFDGLISEGRGQWDSRRVGISLNYNFGNQNVKSRKRKTGIEDEQKRVGSGS